MTDEVQSPADQAAPEAGSEGQKAPKAAPKKKAAPKPKMMEVLLLRGYVPHNPEVLSYGAVVTKNLGPGKYEYEEVEATLKKLQKGTIVKLPEDEAKTAIRRQIAVVPDMATEPQLIQAGLKAPPEDDDE